MDPIRFDRLARGIADRVSRRALLKSAIGVTGALAVSEIAFRDTESARRGTAQPTFPSIPTRPPTFPPEANRTPTPTPTSWCSGTTCGLDCCPADASCCDGACCYGACYGEELCCPTGRIVCNGICCDEGDGCFDEICQSPSSTPTATQTPVPQSDPPSTTPDDSVVVTAYPDDEQTPIVAVTARPDDEQTPIVVVTAWPDDEQTPIVAVTARPDDGQTPIVVTTAWPDDGQTPIVDIRTPGREPPKDDPKAKR